MSRKQMNMNRHVDENKNSTKLASEQIDIEHIREVIGSIEKPWMLDDDSRSAIDSLIRIMLRDWEFESELALRKKKSLKKVKKAKKRAKRKFHCTTRLYPYMTDKHIDALYRKYGIGPYDINHNHRTMNEGLLWFETFSSDYGPYIDKKSKKMSQRKRNIVKNAKKRHQNAIPCNDYRKPKIDWLDVDRCDESNKGSSFTKSEIYNLDIAITYALYPRFCEYKKHVNGFPLEYKSFKNYVNKAIKPVIFGLKLHIIGDDLRIMDWVMSRFSDIQNKDEKMSISYAIEARIHEHVQNAYRIIAENIFTYWV